MADSDRQSGFLDQLAVAVATGSTIRDAAAQLGASESKAYRESAKPEFRQRVGEIRTELCAAAVGKLSKASGKAVDTLRDLLDDEESSIRLQAAKAILGTLPTTSEFAEIRSRLDQIEQKGGLRVVS